MLGARFCRTVPTRITVVEYARTVGSTSPRLRGEHRRPSAAVLSANNADAKHRLWSAASGGGGSPRAAPLENGPHPNPLPASGERERTDAGRGSASSSPLSPPLIPA